MFFNMSGGGIPIPGFSFGGGNGGMSHNIHMFHNGVPINISQAMQRPAPIMKHIDITLEDVLNGRDINAEITIPGSNKKKMINIQVPPGVEHGQQLRDGQQIRDALGQVQQLQTSALAADRRVGAHDFAEARAVDVGNSFEIQQELLLAGSQQAVDLVLQQLVALAKGHLALEVEHGHITYGAFDDFHSLGPLRR